MSGIRLGLGESARAFKGIICDDISGFESHMPSHAVSVGYVWRDRIWGVVGNEHSPLLLASGA
jgi:hypothetical protein